jgi:23S rRNA (adenine2503-C2)-methyltransferase
MPMPKPTIYDLSKPELAQHLQTWGEPKFRINQIWQGLYQSLWNQPDQFTNLPSNLREQLFSQFSFETLTPITTLNSSDRETQKILFHLADGRPIETVRMKYDGSPSSQKGRRTLCISTQSGCGMGCTFCATGQMGFGRNLTSGEIIAQILYFARELKDLGERVTNVVFMGMGEPFQNYDNVIAAIDRLNDPTGMKFGARRFTISTVGLVPAIRQFTTENRQVNLAVSLHAADDELRTSLIPINKRYPIADLMTALRDYAATTKRRITFEWALIQNVTDTPEQAHKLAGLLKGLLAHVNVIPLNPTDGFAGKATTHQRAQAFQTILENKGITCTIRVRRGIDIQAGCGQLASQET